MKKVIFWLFILAMIVIPTLALAASIDIYVRNVSGETVSGAMVRLYDTSWNQVESALTNDFGYVRFAVLDYGTYHYEVYYNSTETEEYWGSDENISLQQPLITRCFTRNWPYKYAGTLPSNPHLGEQVQIEVTVKNNLSFSQDVRVELWVDRDQSSTWDFHETSSTRSVAGGGSTRTYIFNMTLDNSEVYYWRAHVLSYNDGAGSYIVTDTSNWETAFQVQFAPLPAIEYGRLAWHSYTAYDDDGDGYHPIDGRILVYDFSSGTHNTLAENTIGASVRHAMNPNFSKDGRYLTFMGLPKNRSYNNEDDSWANYLDIFIYDFREDKVINLSDNMQDEDNHRLSDFGHFEEDPSFSPDGQWIAFKSQRTDIWAVRLSNYQLRQVTAGDGEESGPQYSPDGQWIYFWWNDTESDGSESYIARIPAEGNNAVSNYSVVVDNMGLQDYFPSYWNDDLIIYTGWDGNGQDGSDDDDILLYDASMDVSYYAAFNSAYPVDDSDAFAISDTLIGYSKRDGSFWALYYGDPFNGDAISLGISESDKHNLGGKYTTSIVNYSPNKAPTNISFSNTQSTISEHRRCSAF